MRRSSLIVVVATIALMALAALAAVDAGDAGERVWWWMTVPGVGCLGAAWLLAAAARRQSRSRQFLRATVCGAGAVVLVPVGSLLVFGPIGSLLAVAVFWVCWTLGAIAIGSRARRAPSDVVT